MAFQQIIDMSAVEREAHQRAWGGYNDFPPKWREIKAGDFAQSLFFTFHPQLVEYRQMLTEARDQPAVSATLYFFHENVGYAIVNDFWGKKIHYYVFGCDQPHPNRHTCPACGFKADYDTSD